MFLGICAGILLVTMLLWGLAFMPAQSAWISQAQYVCFGKMPGGLPDLSGWFILVGSPLLAISATLAIFFDEGVRSIRSIRQSTFLATIVVLLSVGIIAESAWIIATVTKAYGVERDVRDGRVESVMAAIPVFTLKDMHNSPVTEAVLLGKPTIITFAYGHCETMCPGIIAEVVRAYHLMNGKVGVVVITLDPYRDTVSRLQQRKRAWKLPDSAVVLTGSVETVHQVLDQFGIIHQRDPKTGDITHMSQIVLSDGKQIVKKLNNANAKLIVDESRRL